MFHSQFLKEVYAEDDTIIAPTENKVQYKPDSLRRPGTHPVDNLAGILSRFMDVDMSKMSRSLRHTDNSANGPFIDISGDISSFAMNSFLNEDMHRSQFGLIKP